MLHKGAKQCIGTFVVALEPSIMVNSTHMSWQRVCLPLKSCIVDVDDEAVVSMLSHAGDIATVATWSWRDVDVESC
jgi:hypothetical protein